MIQADDFLSSVRSRGYDLWTGVPCSILTPVIDSLISRQDMTYVSASSEGEAIGIAMGAYLAGRKPVLFCQNSGLGNMVNPLTSLCHPFRVPMLMIVTHRGEPGVYDEPQHLYMGSITEPLLEVLGIPFSHFPVKREDVGGVLEQAERSMRENGIPFALIVRRGAVEEEQEPEVGGQSSEVRGQRSASQRSEVGDEEAEQQKTKVELKTPQGEFALTSIDRMLRLKAIEIIKNQLGDEALFIATTGKTGRELFELGHRPGQLYVVGGMGCASGIGLGICLGRPDLKTIVLDGDGAALMKLGSMATIGHYLPENLLHIILDNEAHESTGGQPTVSESVDFAQVASACSYPAAFRCDTPENLKEILSLSRNIKGPVLIHLKVAAGSDPKLGRPTLSPVEVKEQFMEYVRMK